MRTSLVTVRAAVSLAAVVALVAAGCSDTGKVAVPDREGAVKSTASVRAERRAYDGAPPTVPHESFGAACASYAPVPLEELSFRERLETEVDAVLAGDPATADHVEQLPYTWQVLQESMRPGKPGSRSHLSPHRNNLRQKRNLFH